MRTHTYRTELTWSGSTAAGYAAYQRDHRVTLPPGATTLSLSADPAFRGDPALPNPEQLLLAAASSCQLLSFLALAARERIDVVAYEDAAEAFMPEDDRPMRITRITLRPRVTVASEIDGARVRALLERAHDECFIANSLRSQVSLEPETVQLGTRGGDAQPSPTSRR